MESDLPHLLIPGLGSLDAISVAVLAGIALFLMLTLRRAVRNRGAAPQRCRWRRVKNHRRRRPSLKAWSCRNCGIEAFAAGRRPPVECKRMCHPATL